MIRAANDTEEKAACLDEEKEEKVSEKEEQSAIAKFCETISWESQSLPSAVLLVVVEWNEFLDRFTKKREEFSKPFLRTSSETQWPTLNTPEDKLSLRWMLFMLSNVKAELCTGLVAKEVEKSTAHHSPPGVFQHQYFSDRITTSSSCFLHLISCFTVLESCVKYLAVDEVPPTYLTTPTHLLNNTHPLT